jgi:hypothetical protein
VTTTTDRHYLHRLGYHLQNRGLPDERIDDILAEARSHAALSGESLSAAFGAPREYARRWDGPPKRGRVLLTLLVGAAVALGSGALLVGAVRLAGATSWLVPVLLMLVGTAVLVGTAAVVPLQALRDPVSACPRVSRPVAVLTTLGVCALITASGFLGALV